MFSFFKNKKIPITELFPKNFVDIHSHFLPGIDDGSKSLEESVVMLKRMQGYGINHVICTPHIMSGIWDNTPAIIENKLNELQAHLNAIGLIDMHLTFGAEYMLDDQFSTLLEAKNLCTIKDNLLLVEISYTNVPLHLYDLLFKIQIAGYKPILAHPERYSFFFQNYKEYTKLKEAGCLFQLNLLSLSNYYGKDVKNMAVQLLKDGFIDFVGTDTHHSRQLNYLETINDPKILKLIEPILKNNVLF